MLKRRKMLGAIYRPTVLELQGLTTQDGTPKPGNDIPMVDTGELVTDANSPNFGKYAISVANGDEIVTCYLDEPMRSVLKVDDAFVPAYTRGYYDYIEVTDSSVSLVRQIYVADCTDIVWEHRTNGSLWTQDTCAFTAQNYTWWTSRFIMHNGYCSHFRLFGNTYSLYPSNWRNTGCFAVRSGYLLQISPLRSQIGATTENTKGECLKLFNSWIASEKEAGRPVTVYLALKTPTVTDLTDTEFGQALLRFRRASTGSALKSNAIVVVKEV